MKLFKLIYEIEENKNKISLFDKEFIFFHAKKCKIIINNKITSLKEEYQIHEKNVNKLKEFKIKLIIFSEHNLNLKYMFFKCSLKKFSIISSGGDIFENKINDSSNNSNRNIDNNFDDNKFRINYKDENLTITRKNEDPISIKTSFHHKYLNHIYLFQKENSNYSEKEHEKIIFNSLIQKINEIDLLSQESKDKIIEVIKDIQKIIIKYISNLLAKYNHGLDKLLIGSAYIALFSTPECLKGKKILFFRLLSILPMAYIILSLVLRTL